MFLPPNPVWEAVPDAGEATDIDKGYDKVLVFWQVGLFQNDWNTTSFIRGKKMKNEVGSVTAYSQPVGLFTTSAPISKLQTRVDAGTSRFQVRLRLQKHTNYNNKIDALMLTNPKLVITYQE